MDINDKLNFDLVKFIGEYFDPAYKLINKYDWNYNFYKMQYFAFSNISNISIGFWDNIYYVVINSSFEKEPAQLYSTKDFSNFEYITQFNNWCINDPIIYCYENRIYIICCTKIHSIDINLYKFVVDLEKCNCKKNISCCVDACYISDQKIIVHRKQEKYYAIISKNKRVCKKNKFFKKRLLALIKRQIERKMFRKNRLKKFINVINTINDHIYEEKNAINPIQNHTMFIDSKSKEIQTLPITSVVLCDRNGYQLLFNNNIVICSERFYVRLYKNALNDFIKTNINENYISRSIELINDKVKAEDDKYNYPAPYPGHG